VNSEFQMKKWPMSHRLLENTHDNAKTPRAFRSETASSWGAVVGVPLEVRSSSASLYEGQIGNERSGVAALKLDEAGNGMYFLNFFGGTRTFNVLVSSEVAPNTILATSDGIPTTWLSGTPAANDWLLLGAIPGHQGTAISQYPLRSLRDTAPRAQR